MDKCLPRTPILEAMERSSKEKSSLCSGAKEVGRGRGEEEEEGGREGRERRNKDPHCWGEIVIG